MLFESIKGNDLCSLKSRYGLQITIRHKYKLLTTLSNPREKKETPRKNKLKWQICNLCN